MVNNSDEKFTPGFYHRSLEKFNEIETKIEQKKKELQDLEKERISILKRLERYSNQTIFREDYPLNDDPHTSKIALEIQNIKKEAHGEERVKKFNAIFEEQLDCDNRLQEYKDDVIKQDRLSRKNKFFGGFIRNITLDRI